MFQQFNLSTLQKKIVVLGIDGRQISPAEIYKAMNTEDRNTYDREVTKLRTRHLLVEIRTNPQATGIARRNKVSKAEVPRFTVQIPGVLRTQNVKEASGGQAARKAAMATATAPSVAQRYEASSYAVFLMPISDEVTEDEIRALFATAGDVLDIRLPVDRTTGVRRGFGFVYFGSSTEVEQAVKTLNGSTLQGRRLRVDVRR